ncbi:hypothetical protein COV17_02140 [Candidatus Woesearchaeota archaeon CG10_big_fil_rev_8_21_14_0_10_36_11]|nr:MAG: hypothetical protein COV17_02140 [Candidatus Woesearchaeota archaeon CG10_big_fil_rev_8_21_14_0_10_36_11]
MLIHSDYEGLERAILGAIGNGKERETQDILKTVKYLWKGFFLNPVTDSPGPRQFEHDLRNRNKEKDTYCVMIDIDDFRKFNKNYGTLVGDRVLTDVASIISETIRRDDIVARANSYHLHGEELCVLYSCRTLEDAIKVAEKMRSAVERESQERTNHRVTVSLGVAQYCPDEEDFMQTIERADRYMICAKREGKNQVYTNEDKRDILFPIKMKYWYKEGVLSLVVHGADRVVHNVKGLVGRTATRICRVGQELYRKI